MSNRRRPQLKQEVNSKMSHYDVLYRFYEAVRPHSLNRGVVPAFLLPELDMGSESRSASALEPRHPRTGSL